VIGFTFGDERLVSKNYGIFLSIKVLVVYSTPLLQSFA